MAKPKKTKTYYTGAHVYYREGNQTQPYSKVTIPADEKPSVTWYNADGSPVNKENLVPFPRFRPKVVEEAGADETGEADDGAEVVGKPDRAADSDDL